MDRKDREIQLVDMAARLKGKAGKLFDGKLSAEDQAKLEAAFDIIAAVNASPVEPSKEVDVAPVEDVVIQPIEEPKEESDYWPEGTKSKTTPGKYRKSG